MPFTDQFGISRKIEDPEGTPAPAPDPQKLNVPDGMGIIMRTVAQGQRYRHFVRDLAMLLEQWYSVERKKERGQPGPVCVYKEPDLIERTARDFLTDTVDNIICDDSETTEHMRSIAGKISRRAKRHISTSPSARPSLKNWVLKSRSTRHSSARCSCPAAATWFVDETEALIAIDVNTGRNKGTKDLDKTILDTNLEAA